MARDTRAERMARGKEQRRRLPRSMLGAYRAAADRPDPIDIIERSNVGRIQELVPVRHGRMLPSPFTFLRGSAGAMAGDLAGSPNSGIRVQLCGDCHVLNFGGYGSPERNFLFDILDFDETLPGPFEWDVKRLVASLHCSGRGLRITEAGCRDATAAAARAYRQRIATYSEMHALDIWYARLDETLVLNDATDPVARRRYEQGMVKAKGRSNLKLFPKLTETVAGQVRIRDAPPLVFHPAREANFDEAIKDFLSEYRSTLQDDRRTLLDRFRFVDAAMKVVGVGSVGTRCAIVLMLAEDDDPLFLQYKEARASVLESFAGASHYAHSGQRVVAGQRLMQSASDLFLGWATAASGEHYYFRQLRDMKLALELDGVNAAQLIQLAELCGWALARAHSKAGDAASIAGYLGKSDSFDLAMTAFASAYADQTEVDHATMVKAVRSGRLQAIG